MNLTVTGGVTLHGEIGLSGCKHTAQPVLAVSLLCNEKVIINNLPDIDDIKIFLTMLERCGSKIEFLEKHTVSIDNRRLKFTEIEYELTRKMHAGYLLMGIQLVKFQKCRVGFPGGCQIGDRTPRGALYVLDQFGAAIKQDHNLFLGEMGPLKSIHLDLNRIESRETLPATKMALILSALADGETIISNAHPASEIIETAHFLNLMGSRVEGAGTTTIRVMGVKELNAACYTLPADKTEAFTFMAAAAITGGRIILKNAPVTSLKKEIATLIEMGTDIENENGTITVSNSGKMRGIAIETGHPNINTDNQPLFCALFSVSEGESFIKENVWQNRFSYADELTKLGAQIVFDATCAKILGVEKLFGARVHATDIRAAVSLILAGLAAQGKTVIEDAQYINRGYENLTGKLNSIGAEIHWEEV